MDSLKDKVDMGRKRVWDDSLGDIVVDEDTGLWHRFGGDCGCGAVSDSSPGLAVVCMKIAGHVGLHGGYTGLGYAAGSKHLGWWYSWGNTASR